MAPYQENNMGDCPPEFMEFNDQEDEYREEYETGTTETVSVNGKLFQKYENEVRDLAKLGTITLPFKEVYSSLEEFAKRYHGVERDEKTGRYGYWENPNAKWDWYEIGGRWMGNFPVKSGVKPRLGRPGTGGNKAPAGTSDIVRISDIDMGRVMREAQYGIDKFWTNYQAMLGGHRFRAFEGPRSKAVELGLIRVETTLDAPLKPGEVSLGTWKELGHRAEDWRDVYTPIAKDEFIAKYFMAFNPIFTYAVLDDQGWHAPGEMGRFGCSSDTPSEFLNYCNGFMQMIKAVGPEDLLVCVDCHI
jgi:hypothetical protein